MKKLFFAMAAMAAMLTSCSKDDTTTAPVIERSQVTFTVNAPELSTRAEDDYGTGFTAKTLDYVIYDLAEAEGKNQIAGTVTFPDNSLRTEVTVDLVEGREYEAIFFAHAPESPYTFNKTEQTMTINTTKLDANAESYDAFYKYVEPFVMPATGLTKDVEMTRPFAQLNVATNDFDTQAGAMIDAKTTGIEVEAYNTLNFKDGTVDGKETIIYALADKMTGEITANNGEKYSWLTMNYILVNTKENVGVKFLFTDEPNNDEQNPLVREYSAVPVQRNHKTNIIGSILTNKTTFNVEILPGFEDPEHDYNVDATEETVVNNVEDLQNAINNAVEGLNIIKFGKNITAGTTRATAKGIVISQTEGVNIVIDGDNKTFDGTFFINGGSKTSATETLTFTNIKFTHSSGDIDFINGNDASAANRYTHNITVENCTFTGNASGNVVGMRFRQGYGNFNVVNCTVNENMFLLMWATNMTGLVTFDGVTANNNLKEGAISLNGDFKAVIKNSNIATTGYGVRLADKDTNSFDVTFENNTISADVPVAVRNLNDNDKANVSFVANNELETLNNNVYDIVFTESATYNTLKAPAATTTITLTGADSYNVFPRDLVIATAEELKAFRDAVNGGNDYKGKVVKLAANIDLNKEPWTPIGGDDRYANNFAGTFDGMGHTIENLEVVNAQEAGLFGTMTKGVIKNLTIDGVNLSADHYAGGIVGWAEAGGGSLTIENCHVKNATITVSVKDGDLGDKAGGIIGFSYKNTIIGCSVENATITAYRDCGGIVGYANGGTVKNNTVSNVQLIQDNSNNYENIDSETHAKLNFGDIVGRRAGDILEGGNSGTVTKQGGIFDGYYIDEKNGAYNIINAKGLAAINVMMQDKSAGKNVVVNLLADIDFAGKTWTPVDSHADTKFTFKELNGNGHTISNLKINGQAMFTRFAGTGDVTIKDVTFDNATVHSTALNTSILTVQSYQNVLLDNVDVKNSSITGTYKVAPLIATVYNENSSTVTATLKDCDVENVIVKATSFDFCTTGMVAFVNAKDNDKIEFENCTVKDVKLMATPNGYEAHAAVYTTGGDEANLFNEAEGVTVSNVTFEAL